MFRTAVVASLIALSAVVSPLTPIASGMTPEEQRELEAYQGRLEELIERAKALNAELEKPGVPVEKPDRDMCYGLYSLTTGLVEKGVLPAEKFPGIALKREKARMLMRTIWAKEGLDDEGMDLRLMEWKAFYEEQLLDDAGQMKRVDGFVVTRINFCDKQF
jgi:hypothetical protein